MLGLSNDDPVTCDTAQIHPRVAAIRTAKAIILGGEKPIPFEPAGDLIFHPDVSLPYHPNALTFTALLRDGASQTETYYSIGGGFVVREGENEDARSSGEAPVPFPIHRATDLLRHCQTAKLSIPEIVWRNECAAHSPADIHTGLVRIWATMRECAYRARTRREHSPAGLA